MKKKKKTRFNRFRRRCDDVNLGFNAVAGHGALLMPIYLPSKHILDFAYEKKNRCLMIRCISLVGLKGLDIKVRRKIPKSIGIFTNLLQRFTLSKSA